ncbi:tRNA (adenosine(37)-N6)-threonylcarbamoyltransferase complex dimerization subunit type 1 TsaB [Nocardioides massiliensis]|uniref:tRNA threonylcarbamoyl adenosine modification protein YeaZ n=1 Tax=Nocardioides massiliensis TaxID=1325935 RepID=A0ABT9NNR4_9ACTN|nr:tRNA (adenosine(37)-N6)-threonylcarbamoyltransferase complex dimerization subunit type 1 TsaB [Nocardioides massiliensis]MDP9822072.1 tRNA threonylcarbamoyl adenosine modification protein YeaZ [Nocardioides massiliensis]
MLLALDTATPDVTVALRDDERVVASAGGDHPMRHGEQLAPAIAEVLAAVDATPRDVTAIAVGTGPGPFTGLRVGIVTARTMAAVLGIPTYGVCTLDVLAAQAADTGVVEGRFLVASDARRKEVYWAAYDVAGPGEQVVRLDGPQVGAAADLPAELRALPVVGEGGRLYPVAFGDVRGPERPSAAVLAEVVAAERVELRDPEPLYLRRPDAVEPTPRRRVS